MRHMTHASRRSGRVGTYIWTSADIDVWLAVEEAIRPLCDAMIDDGGYQMPGPP